MAQICKEPGCENKVKSFGLCLKHYMRMRRHGSTADIPRKKAETNWRRHFMYGSWAAMVNRCHNTNNSSYGRYGARGITVCNRWRFGEGGLIGFRCFLEDMGERPEGMTLDRIDPLGPYSRENCRWATAKEQRANLSEDGDRRMREAARVAANKSWETGRLKPRGQYI